VISVVLPVLDGAEHLTQALESAPPAGADEVVVVDGGSSDDSRKIAAGFDFVRLLEQRGPELSDAYNEGIAAARGDRLGFLGHDDIYEPGALSALAEELGDAAAAFGRLRYELLGERPPPGFRAELLGEPRDAFGLEAMLASRTTVDRVGSFRYQTAHDVDWLARLRETGLPIVRIPTLVASKRIRAESTGYRDTAREPEQLVRILRDSIARRRGETA